MKVALKKIPALFLLAIIAMPVFFAAYFFIAQESLHYRRQDKFKKEKLVTLTIPVHQIIWVKKDKEVLIDGKLFDVKVYQLSGNNLLLTGFYDKKETSLVAKANKINKATDSEQSPLAQLTIKYLLQVMLVQKNPVPATLFILYHQDIFPHFSEHTLFRPKPIILVPPRFC